MLRHLLGGEDEFAVGHLLYGRPGSLLKSIDDQRALDLDRLAVLAEEHHPPAEPAPGGQIALMHYRIGPHAHDSQRRLRLGPEHALAPGDVFPHVELRAAAGRQQQARREQGEQVFHGDFLSTGGAGGMDRTRGGAA